MKSLGPYVKPQIAELEIGDLNPLDIRGAMLRRRLKGLGARVRQSTRSPYIGLWWSLEKIFWALFEDPNELG